MRTLFVDDDESFVDVVLNLAKSKGREIYTATSVRAAKDLLRTNTISRVICDLRLEGEEETGVDVLEFATQRNLEVGCVLLTGKQITEAESMRLEALGATIIHKSSLSSSLMGELLFADSLPRSIEHLAGGVDIGELRLRIESLQDELATRASEVRLRGPSEEGPADADAQPVRERIRLAYEEVVNSQVRYSAELHRVGRVTTVVTTGSMVFIFTCLLLVVLGAIRIALASGILSLLLSAISHLLLQREQKLRQASRDTLRDIGVINNAVLLFNFCQSIQDPGRRDAAIALLVASLATPGRNSGDD